MAGGGRGVSPPPFVVLALPRSRTKWLSAFLSYANWQCGHEELRHCRSLDDVRSWLSQPWTGTCETAAAPFWRLLTAWCPEARIVVVHRSVAAVAASLRAAGMAFDDAVMLPHLERAATKLRQIEARLSGVLSVPYEDLRSEAACAVIFEHCLELPHDHGWWRILAGMNLQVSVPHMLRYFDAHRPQVEKLRRMARHEMLRGLRRPTEINGVSFQQEGLHEAFADRDGQRLMSDECAGLGEYPEAWEHMNIPLLARLEEMGNLHIYTARTGNGRMAGYVVSAIGEAFHALGQAEAEQVSFYADTDFPGLGRKLQHAAIEDLRARGVDRVMMFQPDSSRVGLLYRRLGARQTGQRYVLELQS